MRFITVTSVRERMGGGESETRRAVNVSRIVEVIPYYADGAQLLIDGLPDGFLRVRESPDKILTMINAGAYVPPF